jgi:hydroxymethylglutaryl-CoA reductase
VQRIVARIVQNRLVVHLHVDTRDAMGANTVNTLCEAIAPDLAEATGGTVGLRILSNLATERLATARCSIPFAAVGGRDAAQAIVEANEFARIDPYRATTHNKGIMNGIDPVLIATGNDWRAVEAGAHAYAARDGHYAALTTWRLGPDALEGELTIPMQLGTVGGVTSLHPMSRVCLRLMGDPDAQHLAAIVVAVGLAQNLAALRALSQEGIQQGHMELHARNLALQKSQGDAGARNRS